MSAERQWAGLRGVCEGAATIAGTLSGAGIDIRNADGTQVKSEPAALAAAMWFAYLNEAATMVDQGYATRDDVDAAMRFGCGFPVGPLQVLDTIGLDNAAAILGALGELSGDPRHDPAEGLTARVQRGHAGVESGAGYYRYALGTDEVVDAEPSTRASGHVRQVSKVAVVGSGTMATGMAEVFAKAGLEVTLIARSEEKASAAVDVIAKSIGRAVAKGRMSQESCDSALARISPAAQHMAAGDADLVIEAIVEEIAPKRELFGSLDQVCREGAILATTTSSLSIEDIAWATGRPESVIGMHFFNPAAIMKLVEVVSTRDTAADVVNTALDFCARVGKVPVRCGDRAGFIVNFLLFPFLNDAVRALDDRLATVDGFDPVIKTWQGIPLGPYSLLDVVGNDVSLAIEQTIFGAFGKACYRPAGGLVRIVAEGKLGRKTGVGFRDYR